MKKGGYCFVQFVATYVKTRLRIQLEHTDICFLKERYLKFGELTHRKNYTTKRTYNCTYVYMSYAEGYNLQTGIDALEFVQGTPYEVFAQIDDMVRGPPYMNPLNVDHMERLTTRTRQFNNKVANRFMSREKRREILPIIREKLNPSRYILQFHTIREELIEENRNCLHLWVKIGASALSGS